jgi:hypothetical protein
MLTDIRFSDITDVILIVATGWLLCPSFSDDRHEYPAKQEIGDFQ